METYPLENDLTVFYVEAKSFPQGIGEAFITLMKKLPFTEGRTFFGISYMDKSRQIVYKAAVLETFEGEGKKSGCKSFIIKKGNYNIETITDWRGKEPRIRETFGKLLMDPELDPKGACIEWYTGDDVMCMVRLKDPG